MLDSKPNTTKKEIREGGEKRERERGGAHLVEFLFLIFFSFFVFILVGRRRETKRMTFSTSVWESIF